jgi:hypothetical protein
MTQSSNSLRVAIIELFGVDEGLLPRVVIPPITAIAVMLRMSCRFAALVVLPLLLHKHQFPTSFPTIGRRGRGFHIVGPTTLHNILKHTNHLVNPLIHLIKLALQESQYRPISSNKC